jgi:carboxymethylenebutenolidase
MYAIETVAVQGSAMEVFIFTPYGSGLHPAVILAQHIPIGHTGIENDVFTLKTAERFAANGFVIAVPFIFHWWPKDEAMERKRQESRDDWMAADMKAAFELLAARDDVNNDAIGMVGHCWGGRVAWVGACHIKQLKALAVFYGGRIKDPMGAGNPAPIELVGNIPCPVVGFFGNDDQNPSPQDVDDYDAALTAAGIAHSFHRYDGAGHAFQNFHSADRYREKQSEDAWVKVLDFLHRQLG